LKLAGSVTIRRRFLRKIVGAFKETSPGVGDGE